MGHDDAGLLPTIVTVVGTVLVAIIGTIATLAGKRAAAKDEPFVAQEHGEHAHTRDLIKLEAQRVMDRIDASDTARGLRAQSDQRGISARRLLDGSES